MQDVNWIYRVAENDDDGDPLDFGVVSGFPAWQAARKLHHWLTVDLELDDSLTLYIYPVKYPDGVWHSEKRRECTIADLLTIEEL